jgi:hypothetical protein
MLEYVKDCKAKYMKRKELEYRECLLDGIRKYERREQGVIRATKALLVLVCVSLFASGLLAACGKSQPQFELKHPLGPRWISVETVNARFFFQIDFTTTGGVIVRLSAPDSTERAVTYTGEIRAIEHGTKAAVLPASVHVDGSYSPNLPITLYRKIPKGGIYTFTVEDLSGRSIATFSYHQAAAASPEEGASCLCLPGPHLEPSVRRLRYTANTL